MDPTSLSAWAKAAGDAAQVVEQHPTISTGIVAILIAFGTPEIGPKDKPWLAKRQGLVLPLVGVAVRAVEAYISRTQVFKGLEEEIATFRSEIKELGKRVGESEKVVSWQTQVLMAISSALKIDVLTLLHRHESEAPVSTTAVSALAGIGSPGVPRDSIPNLSGEERDECAKSTASGGRLPLDSCSSIS